MSLFSPAEADAVRIDPRLLAGLGFAALIAWFQPFDLTFAALSFGSPLLRASEIIAMAVLGSYFGGRVGLRLAPEGQRRPILFPVAVASLVAVACVAMDWLFRPVLHGPYIQLITQQPLLFRIVGFMARAVNENIIYRLFLGSLLAWLLGLIWKDAEGRPSRGAFFVAFALSQGANTWINVTSQAPLGLMPVLHDTLRYFAPGMVWSWIYWKRGFQANEIASTSVHLFFQPLATMFLATSP